MRVLITGLSSFTGAWFAATLARDGHAVTGVLRRALDGYGALEQARIAFARDAGVTLVDGIAYGDDQLASLAGKGFDVIGYHGADVRDYRSADFDVIGALATNTRGIRDLCRHAVAGGVGRLVVTGSVGEPFEGSGDEPSRAISPYGLSKALSWDLIRHSAREAGLACAKFVVPNPFGVYEQERYCTYLVRTWLGGGTAEVRTPGYIRDNIPIDKLARAYADFVAISSVAPGAASCRPSGYVGSQADFTARFAREIGGRLKIKTPFMLADQRHFDEPRVRINIDRVAPDWDEAGFWDALASYYADWWGGTGGVSQ